MTVRRRLVSGPVTPRIGLIPLFLFLLPAMVAAQAQPRPDALVLYRQGQYERAVEVTIQELQENSANLDAYTVLGWSLLELLRYRDALEYGQRALRVSRYDHRILYIVSEAHYGLGNFTDALQYLQEYAAVMPEGRYIGQVYYLMGEVLLRFEEYHHADIAFTKAVHHVANRPQWWMRLGYAREMAGYPVLAIRAYEEALERNPNLLDARRALDRMRTAP
jgi:tetratricopeptide (TPR) repeat protein